MPVLKKADNWVEASVISCSLQNVSEFNMQVWASHAAPLDDEFFFVFLPYQVETFDLSDGKKLYVKNKNDVNIKWEVLV